MRIVIITNMPAPYRIPSWNKLATEKDIELVVIFCTRKEPNRNWTLPQMLFKHIYLKENFRVKKDGITFVHNNKDVVNHLKKINPDIVITGGFNPTMLYAFLYCLIRRKKHIPMSDAWKFSEQHLSFIHRSIRKIVYRFSHAFIACSIKGKLYYEDFRIEQRRIFISHYSITNEAFANSNDWKKRPYDLMFSGQFIKRKNPDFFIEVAALVQLKRPGLKILLLGDGPMKEELLNSLQMADIDFTYPGFSTQESLPAYYSQARLFLFPTEYDAWGVVAHEALAAGTPVLITPFAGCSGELVVEDHNGYILGIDKNSWAEKCLDILSDTEKWNSLSSNAFNIARQFNADRSASSLMDACRFVADNSGYSL